MIFPIILLYSFSLSFFNNIKNIFFTSFYLIFSLLFLLVLVTMQMMHLATRAKQSFIALNHFEIPISLFFHFNVVNSHLFPFLLTHYFIIFSFDFFIFIPSFLSLIYFSSIEQGNWNWISTNTAMIYLQRTLNRFHI